MPSLKEMESLQNKGIHLTYTVKDILRPLVVNFSLQYSDWREQCGYERKSVNGGFAYYLKRFVAWSLVEKDGNEYIITSKGLMAYCILVDKPLDFMVERLAQECNENLAKLVSIKRDLKRLQRFIGLSALQNNSENKNI